MKSMMVVMAMVIGMMVFGGFAVTADEAAVSTVAGTVSVVAGDAGAVAAVVVTDKDGVAYTAVACEKCDELAKLAGAAVKVTGVVADVDGKKTIKITAFEKAE